jgi:hypothetical protein
MAGSGSVSKSSSRRASLSEVDAPEMMSDPPAQERSACVIGSSDLCAVEVVQLDGSISVPSCEPITGSLAVTVRATVRTMPITTGRRAVAIPGAGEQWGGTQVGASSKSRHLSPILRYGVPLSAIVACVLFSLFSLSPLADGYAGVPIVGYAVQLVHIGPVNWSLLIGDHAPITQVGPTPTPQPQVSNPGPVILPDSDYVVIARQAAASAGIPQDYFVRQINEESGFNPYARSSAGAVGIAQFEPSTAAGLGVNPYDPVSALYGAARYMARLANSYGGNYAKALAAYNAGPPAVTRAVNGGGANWLAYMPAETQRYVHAIMG